MKPISKRLICILLFIYLGWCQPTPSDSCLVFNTNYSTCIECVPGLYLQYFFCIPCNPLCTCTANTTYCDACLNITLDNRKLMSYRSGDICVLCNSTIPLCIQCDNNGLTCSRCMLGRYVINGTCSNTTCEINCEICLDQFNCQICALGYSLDITTHTCSNSTCIQNCLECQNISTCKICTYGYFPVNGTCNLCIQNCAVCNNTQTCLICLPSYILSNDTCQSTGLSNCIAYTGGVSNPTCLVCQPGFYNAGGSCTQCSGCLLCTQSFLCQTPCLPGYIPFNFACIQFQLKHFFSFIGMLIFSFFSI